MTIDLESLRGFTPGPWRLSGVDVVNGDDHWCINGHALVEGFHSPTDCRLATVYTIEANARLIAAAPFMHAELTARRARDADVEVLVEALKKAAYHLASIGFPVDRNGRYDKDGEWTFAAAVPRAVDAGEVATAFHTINAALAPFTGATHDRD